MAFYFGLLAQGPHPWTLFNEGGAAMGTFEVEPLEDLVSLEPGLAAGSTEPGSLRDFTAWRLFVPEGHYVMTRVVPSTDAALSPLQWLLAEDGVGLLASEQDELLIWHSPEERAIFLRVQDLAASGGAEFDVDLALVEAGAPEEQLESEPNDAPESWQDLGVLGTGLHRLMGTAATAGHDGDSEPNGDLDVFRFRVSEDTRVSFELSWTGEQDFDAVLYQDEGVETQLGFASDQAISLQMASTAQPERAELELSADGSYLLMVANWWGEPAAPWEVLVNVYPGSFP